MYVTNLTNKKLGINGALNLAPFEVNRYVNNKDKGLVARVVNLENANMVSVIREEGFTKIGIPGKVVKTIGVDEKGLDKAPRSAKVKPPVATKESVAPKAEKVEKIVEAVKEEVAPVIEEPVAEVAEEKVVKPAKSKLATKIAAKAKAASKATEEASEDK